MKQLCHNRNRTTFSDAMGAKDFIFARMREVSLSTPRVAEFRRFRCVTPDVGHGALVAFGASTGKTETPHPKPLVLSLSIRRRPQVNDRPCLRAIAGNCTTKKQSFNKLRTSGGGGNVWVSICLSDLTPPARTLRSPHRANAAPHPISRRTRRAA